MQLERFLFLNNTKLFMKILIVDDDQDVMMMLEFRLKKSGHELFKAVNGTEALKQIKAAHPDLILIDLNIPEPNGIEVTNRIKKDPKTAKIPVILLTGSSELSDIQCNADAVMIKPYEWKTLENTIKKLSKT